MKTAIITKKIEDFTIIWFNQTNNYVVVNHETAEVINLLNKNYTIHEIASNLSTELNIPSEDVILTITKINTEIFLPNCIPSEKLKQTIIKPSSFNISTFYKINNIIFKVDFQTEEEKFWVHPKFAHLEINPQDNFNEYYQVFSHKNLIILYVNNEQIGAWNKENIHYFQGKFSMEMVQSIHKKSEENWMGVFHASAVSDQKNAMLFLGDSGNGKSTSLALLQSNGFTCIADDFVPIDSKEQNIYSFPSAISIKKNSVPVLIDLYPELITSAEYHLKRLGKIVRYLPPNTNDYTKKIACKALVFIKYEANSGLEISNISKIDAFQKLVPDSWLSPIQENAKIFLDWFSELPCYQLTYSDNQKMIETVTKLFNDEL